jgi:phage terminase large subunit-like protein
MAKRIDHDNVNEITFEHEELIFSFERLKGKSVEEQIRIIEKFFPPSSIDDQLMQAKGLFEDRKFEIYEPTPKQMEFHDATKKYKQILFLAGNQIGKTVAACMQIGMWCTGIYPEWYNGRKFHGAVDGWVCSVDIKTLRESIQLLLLGKNNNGSGYIPKKYIEKIHLLNGGNGAADKILVKHVSGQTSSLIMKTYEMGRESFQSSTLHFIELDEQCPNEIYEECLPRLNRHNGSLIMTYTPLLGRTTVLDLFYPKPKDDYKCLVHATIDDATFYSKERIEEIKAQWVHNPSMYATRINGIPLLGSGRVFEVTEEDITCTPFEVPEFWPGIIGMDYGYSSLTTAVKIRVDSDNDVYYITHVYAAKEKTSLEHAYVVKRMGDYPVAYGLEAFQRDKGSGIELRDQYAEHGLRMMKENAKLDIEGDFDKGKRNWHGGYGRESTANYLHNLMKTGRLKIFNHEEENKKLVEEIMSLHRNAKTGKIADGYDDRFDGMKYGLMMAKHAEVPVNVSTGSKSIKLNLMKDTYYVTNDR